MRKIIIDTDLEYTISLIDLHIVSDDQTVLFVTQDIQYVKNALLTSISTKSIQVDISSIYKDNNYYTLIIYDMFVSYSLHKHTKIDTYVIYPSLDSLQMILDVDEVILIKQYNTATSICQVSNSLNIVPDDTECDIESFNKGILKHISLSLSQVSMIDIPVDYMFLYSPVIVRHIPEDIICNISCFVF